MNFWDIIRWPFAQVLRLCYDWFGSYALALLLFAIVIKVVLIPFGIKQQKTQIKTAKLRPKMYAIEKKYAGRTDRKTLEKKQQEIMELQREEGFSPFSGCLPLLIQLPIIIILYNIIQNPLTYICQFTEPQMAEIVGAVRAFNPNLPEVINQFDILSNAKALLDTAPDALGALSGSINDLDLSLFGGLDLMATPNLSSLTNFSSATWLLLVPVFVFLSSFFSMKLSRKFMANPAAMAVSEDVRKSNTIMDFVMPAMSIFISFSVPAALGLYWIYQSVLGVAQQYILAKAMPLPTFSQEELRAMQKAEKERQAAAMAAAKQRRAQYALDDDDEEDFEIPEVKSRFDNDEDDFVPPVKKKKK